MFEDYFTSKLVSQKRTAYFYLPWWLCWPALFQCLYYLGYITLLSSWTSKISKFLLLRFSFNKLLLTIDFKTAVFSILPKKYKIETSLEIDFLFHEKWTSSTGKSFSEALILASVNPQYEKRLFIEFPEKYKFRTCCVQILFWMSKQKQKKTIFVHNMF